MSVTLVQHKHTTAATITFDDAPTTGNVLLLAAERASNLGIDGDTGWALIGESEGGTGPGFSRPLVLYGKVAGGSQTAGPFSTTGVSEPKHFYLAEFATPSGWALAPDVVDEVTDLLRGTQNPVILTADITPDPDSGGVAVLFFHDSNSFAMTADAPSENIDQTADSEPEAVGFIYQEYPVAAGPVTLSSHWSGLAFDARQGWIAATWTFTPPPPPEPGVILDPVVEIDATPVPIGLDVMEWVIRRGSGPEVTSAAQPGSATVKLRNTDDKYNPENSGSPLIDYLRDGTSIWLGINNDGLMTGEEPRGLFGGRITDITVLPYAGQDDAPWVELQCEDSLGWYARTPVTVPFTPGLTQKELREAILASIGETRMTLDHEIHTMPLAGADGNGLDALDAINAANGTRHFAKPADDPSEWYRYTTYNRQHGLSGVADAELVSTDILAQGVSGWRLGVDTVRNQQRAAVTPITFTPSTTTVWTQNPLPLLISPDRPFEVWVDFDDYVLTPLLNLSYSGDAPTSVVLQPFGNRAKLTITQTGSGDETTIDHLTIEGSLARRWPDESWVADDPVSQLPPRGVRRGNDIRGEYVGTLATARGIAEHVVWRYAQPQTRPTLTVANWFPEMFDRDLGDLLEITFDEVGITSQLFEIVGLTHRGIWVVDESRSYHTTEYVLQKSRVQSDPGWFTWDVSEWNGTDVLGY